ncbi:hypothetical protein THAOC_10239 [Thalassiosira oceanica]|uniref:ATP-dependent RNA helicase n=1 Tax=Thalassiosira oceanica TaxID=159749 RepID=K0SQJ2_THAOC|nr:hypothetical protein THAOC_10239 [Thalassiosira oceanica]|eukprot:EJK68568.1 hypothetical protein THAOC_10239 [Thalassiosira oceanica]
MDPPSSAGHSSSSMSGSSPSASAAAKAPQKKGQKKKQKKRDGSTASTKQPSKSPGSNSHSSKSPSEPSLTASSVQSTTIIEREVSQSQDNAFGEALVIYEHSEDQSEIVEGPTIYVDDSKRNELALVAAETQENDTGKGYELAIRDEPDMRRGFDHCFVKVPTKDRLSVLFATLRRSAERKVIVICSTWESASFHATLFRQLEMANVVSMHEHLEKDDDNVVRAYNSFIYHYPGIMFASDVSLREFEIPPNVDYVIQYEPPMNPIDYVYRMRESKMYDSSCHKALIFLTPDELNLLEIFEFNKIQCSELEARRVDQFKQKVEKLLVKHKELNDLAWRAFRSFCIAYEGHPSTKIYGTIDEDAVRTSFATPHLPEEYMKYSPAAAPEKKQKEPEERTERESRSRRKSANEWMDKNEKTWRKGKHGEGKEGGSSSELGATLDARPPAAGCAELGSDAACPLVPEVEGELIEGVHPENESLKVRELRECQYGYHTGGQASSRALPELWSGARISQEAARQRTHPASS